MPKANHHTKLDSANVVSSGSGNIYVGGSFIPKPTLPANNCNLPHRHPHFIGREEDIKKVIDALGSRAWIVTIDGMGGIGKTTLSLEVAHLCKERNPITADISAFTGFIWVSARDKPDFCLDDVVKEILYVLSSFETKSRKLSSSEELGLAIRALAAEPRLLIIDNFETVKDEALHRFLRDQIPSPSKVLITSRHHIKTGERVITIGGLEEDAAVQLLRHEADRLQIPIRNQDTARLHIIAQKAFGIPLVLRWVMEMVYNGKSLEWTLQSLEHADANDIFDYIFEHSLSALDLETRFVFSSLSIFITWTRMEAIRAINSEITAIQDRVAHLVSLSLIEDNRSLVDAQRCYTLHPFTRYLATRELLNGVDKGKGSLKRGLAFYQKEIEAYRRLLPYDYLEKEFDNISHITRMVADQKDMGLLEKSIQLVEALGNGNIRLNQMVALVEGLRECAYEVGDPVLVNKLLALFPNPYITHGPVPSEMFFGREETLKRIRSAFESNWTVPAISLVGPRRIGKTSLLRYVYDHNRGHCIYVYIDLQALPSLNQAAVFHLIAQQIESEFKKKQIEIQQPNDKYFNEQSRQAFKEYIVNATKKIGDLHLVLIMDEFDRVLIPYTEEERKNARDILNFFRHIATDKSVSILTAGTRSPYEMSEQDIVSPFFNIVSLERISGIDQLSAIDLIRRPIKGLLNYDDSALGQILHLTGCYPFLIQDFCSQILNYCVERGETNVDRDTVDTVAQLYIKNEEYIFGYYLLDKLTDLELKIVQAAASLLDNQESTFTHAQIMAALPNDQIQLLHLESLGRRDVLQIDGNDNFKFFMELYRQFIKNVDIEAYLENRKAARRE